MDKPPSKITITLLDQAESVHPLVFIHYHQDLDFDLPATPAERLADTLVRALNGYAVHISKAPATPMAGVDIDVAHRTQSAQHMPIQMLEDDPS